MGSHYLPCCRLGICRVCQLSAIRSGVELQYSTVASILGMSCCYPCTPMHRAQPSFVTGSSVTLHLLTSHLTCTVSWSPKEHEICQGQAADPGGETGGVTIRPGTGQATSSMPRKEMAWCWLLQQSGQVWPETWKQKAWRWGAHRPPTVGKWQALCSRNLW